MQLTPVSLDEFFTYFPSPRTPYGSRGFIDLVAPKAEELAAFVLLDSKGKARLGLVAGRRGDGKWYAPWSAPFAEVMYNKPQGLETCIAFANQLRDCLKVLRVTLPPKLYDPLMQPLLEGALQAAGFACLRDYNYHVPLGTADPTDLLNPNARNHYNRALKAGFTFNCDAPLDEAYAVIAENRRRRGYPLAMSLEQLRATEAAGVELYPMVLSLDAQPVASAISYRISSHVAQLIYWGDVGGFERLRPMNLLAVSVYRTMQARGFGILDLGPSSSDGQIDLGLCVFKESVGGELSFKPVFNII